ncbi:hypothetical protein [Streptomyces sp. NPDC007984]|uniref:hypothetical protein n=1 Tax=Streptomyces sp. NPDC007984 TaxID=3364801 RepID=UPI0036F0FBD2
MSAVDVLMMGMGKIDVHRAALALPDVAGLQDRARAIATVELITGNEWGYEYVPSDCPGNGGHVLRMREWGRHYVEVHFHEDVGALVFGYDIEAADFNNFDRATGEKDVWRDILAQIPEGLRHCVWHGEYDEQDHERGDCSGDAEHLSAVTWRLPSDTAWQTAQFTVPDWAGNGRDGAWELCTDLIDPAPRVLTYGIGPQVREESPAAGDATEHVMAGRPLTEEVVRALNPERSLSDLAEAVAAIGTVKPRSHQ